MSAVRFEMHRPYRASRHQESEHVPVPRSGALSGETNVSKRLCARVVNETVSPGTWMEFHVLEAFTMQDW